MRRRCSEMRTSYWTITLFLALVGLFSLAIVMAPDAEASITGVQPPASGDWIIDQDTSVLGEVLTIKGDIIVRSGYDLFIKNSNITMACTFSREFGIMVDAGTPTNGYLEMTDSSIVPENKSNGWTFSIDGDANLHDAVKLFGIVDGVRIYGDDVTISDSEIHSSGSYGVYIYRCDPTLKGVLIVNSNVFATTWSGTYRSLPTVYGIRIYGSSIEEAAPTLESLDIRIKLWDTWSQSVYSSITENMNIYGMYATYADLGTPTDIDISIDTKVNASVTFSSSYAYFYSYMYIYGIYLTGGTSYDGFSDVVLSDSNYLIDVDQTGSSYARIYDYFYFYGLYNSVSSSGSVPDTLSGLTIQGHQPEVDTHNAFRYNYHYLNGEGIHWYPSTSAAPPDDFFIDNVTIDGISVYKMIAIPENWDLTIKNSKFNNNKIGDDQYHYPYGGFLSIEYWDKPVTIQDNEFINNTATRYTYFFNLRYLNTEFNMLNNNISENKFYYFVYAYSSTSYSEGEFTIWDNTFMNNTFDSYMWYHYYSRSIDFQRNDLSGNRMGSYFMRLYYVYGDVTFKDNVFFMNQGSSYWFYVYYIQNGVTFDFSRNQLANNTFSYFMRNSYNYGPIVFNDNDIRNNVVSSYLLYAYGPRGGDITIIDNELFNNRFSTSGFYFGYIGQHSASYKIDLDMQSNNFINNSGSTGARDGLIKFYDPGQDITSENNYFEGNSANCIALDYTYGYYAWQYTFTVQANEFVNNSGIAMTFDRLDNINIIISKNKATGGEDYSVYMVHTDNYRDGPDSIAVQNNNFSNNPGGGIYLTTSHYYSYYWGDFGNPDQTVSIKRNNLRNNGAKGWSLALIGLYSKPNIQSNDMAGSAMGLYMERVDDDARSKDFKMNFIEEVMDGGADGVTAYGFAYIDADFQRCSMLNFSEALYAKDCGITVWSSKVPEASGKTEGTGRIYVWNYLEMVVTWANASGVDSGHPVDKGTIAMMGANGEYFGGLETDENGYIDIGLINPWTCAYGEMNAWSPFSVTILSNGISTPHMVSVVGDFISPNAKKVLLVDDEVPQVLISNPQDGVMVATDDVLTEGFLFEIGSGVVLFEGRTEAMAQDDWVSIETSVIWQILFGGMKEGEHLLTVRAADLSGNWNTSNASIIVDLTSPVLDVHMEYTDARDVPFNETRKGYFVRADSIIINGTYSDNFAELREIEIRFNGVREVIFLSRLGTLYREIELIEGFNTIIVDAIDVAGNRQIVEFFITQDSNAPTIYVYSPRQNEAVGDANIDVDGLTEPNTKVEVRVESTSGTNMYSATSDEHGAFMIPVELFEGFQKVLVTAIDPSLNQNQTYRDVILDTIAPDFVINNPPTNDIITKESRIEIICTMLPGGLDSITSIGGQEIPNEGVFKRWIVLQEGPNVIEIVAIDPVGNEQAKVVNIVRDTVKPVLTVTLPEGDYLLTNTPLVRFEGQVEGADPTGGVVIVHKSIDFTATLVSGAWEDMASWSYDLELGPQDLEQYIDVKAFDQAGNEIIQIYHIVYDEIAPVLRLDDIPSETETSVLTINGSTDVSISTIYVEGNPFPVIDGEFGIAWPLSEGNNTLMVEVHDEADNSASKSLSITYNPPRITDGGGGGGGEEDNFSQLVAWILILAAITLIGTAFVVSRSRTRRR
jgi:hypothetical protein